MESADPNAIIDEDDTNISWGHAAFTTGELTFSSVLSSVNNWVAVGKVFAARIIAGAIKTCLVARHVCCVNGIPDPPSYLSDSYLENILDKLWQLWLNNAVSALPLSRFRLLTHRQDAVAVPRAGAGAEAAGAGATSTAQTDDVPTSGALFNIISVSRTRFVGR